MLLHILDDQTEQAASRGRPDALQIADRWHLMENASASFLQAVRRSMHPVRSTQR